MGSESIEFNTEKIDENPKEGNLSDIFQSISFDVTVPPQEFKNFFNSPKNF